MFNSNNIYNNFDLCLPIFMSSEMNWGNSWNRSATVLCGAWCI